MPLIHECSYEFDISEGKDLIATSLVGMRIMCHAICTEILEALVCHGLLDTQKDRDLVQIKALLIE